MNTQVIILILSMFAALLSGCNHPQFVEQTQQNEKPEIMSEEEALHILNDVDPYSREAMDALVHYHRLKQEAERKQLIEEYRNCSLLKSPLSLTNSSLQNTGDIPRSNHSVATIKGNPDLARHISAVLYAHKIGCGYGGSMSYFISVNDSDRENAKMLLKKDSEIHGYEIKIEPN